mgnify:CR=1 FL=1
MTVKASPRGTFFIARYRNLAVFDRDRRMAIRRLSALVWGGSHG